MSGRRPTAVLRHGLERLHEDYVLSSRLDRYAALLESARSEGYTLLSVSDYWDRLQSSGGRDGRVLILRHDIDTDPAASEDFFQVEDTFGARATFYFRLSTGRPPLMRSLAGRGADVGYHFEELASVAKERGVTTPADVERILPEARARFVDNIESMRQLAGSPMNHAASHGDFANRKLGMRNTVLLEDGALRVRSHIDFEAYDAAMMDSVTARFCDAGGGRWTPDDPFQAIREHSPVVYLLTHPRSWIRSIRSTSGEDIRRIAEGVYFGVGVRCPITKRVDRPASARLRREAN